MKAIAIESTANERGDKRGVLDVCGLDFGKDLAELIVLVAGDDREHGVQPFRTDDLRPVQRCDSERVACSSSRRRKRRRRGQTLM